MAQPSPTPSPVPARAPVGFAPDFATDFATDFGGFLARSAEPPPWLVAGDLQILADVRARLDASGAFAAVAAGMPNEDPHEAITSRPLAIVSPASAEEDDAWQDLWIRTLRVRVAIVAEGQEPESRHDGLDRLARAALNALTRVSLADLTLPAKTKAVGQQYGPTRNPDQSVLIDLSCPYFIDPEAGRPVE